ncbi:MAG: aminotransferase class V-fold PLP-dependent enzyme [Mycetocola sp.]
MTGIDEFIDGFGEESGYLDYGRVGPLSAVVQDEIRGQVDLLGRARFGVGDALVRQNERMLSAVSVLTGFPTENIVSQPNTSMGLMHTMFGITGGLLLSAGDFPSLTVAATRAADALQVLTPTWLDTDEGRVTPHAIMEQLTPNITAVAVSLVDTRTGYLADLDGIRQVIGDRLLIVDAIQGFGVVDAPYEVADVIASGGQKWVRAGQGTGFLALSDRALDHLVPVMSGYTGTDEHEPWDAVPPPSKKARAFSVANADFSAQARMAAALEEIAGAGVDEISTVVTDRVSEVLDLADEFAVSVASPRAPHERAGIVILAPPEDQVSLLVASLHNHGVSSTLRQNRVRLSVHAGTTSETLGMLRDSLVSFSTAIAY